MLKVMLNAVYLISNFRGLVPLHNACSYGHYEVTEQLVKVRAPYLFLNGFVRKIHKI